MLRMFQSQTIGQAKRYFQDALSKADYYLEDQDMNGTFHGRVAARLGLNGEIATQSVFDQLCDNIHPQTGGHLTPRVAADRRVGYDISFHAPKSVSILHALGKDKRILEVFQESVDATMHELEQEMQTRVRVQGQDHDRDTGEMLWTDFVHQTARPVDGYPPDPHLHCHCFTFNVTYDHDESRFKAGQFHDLKKDMPYHQARFQKRLADGLAGLGYGVRKTQNGFELSMIPQRAIDYFSKRTNLIGQVAKEQGVTDPKELDELGARTRAKKEKNMTMPDLQNAWRKGLKEAGIDAQEREEVATQIPDLTPRRTIDYTLDHCFTRASVKRDRQILTEAYKYAIDHQGLGMDQIDQAFEADDRVYKIQDGKTKLCTTMLVQKEERDMVQKARSFRGSVKPIKHQIDANDLPELNDQQEAAVRHVLGSSDRLMMIRGGAGTGKTTLIKHAVKEIETTGRKAFLFAPTSDASRDVLRKEGFENADTVARLLKDDTLQEQLEGQVIWVDEAGMLGAQDTLDLLNLTQEKKARLVLSGDPKQHSAVHRGDAMRILQQVGRIPYQNVEVIYRQRVNSYREAVDHLSKGEVGEAFEQLDQIGSLKQVDSAEVVDHLVNDYVDTVKENKSALVVSPTNTQAGKINIAIRDKLHLEKKLKKRERNFTVYRNLYLTEAQKKDARLYRPGQIIQAHQNTKTIKRGQRVEVTKVEGDIVTVSDGQRQCLLDRDRVGHYDVYTSRQIPLSKGDQIRINKNGFDLRGKRLDNGKVLSVTGFHRDGSIIAENAYSKTNNRFKLARGFGNFDYAYCLTSYSSQGKTVDKVFIAQPSDTFPASNQKQFYVSVSRGRDSVTIYTDNKTALKQSVSKDGDRMSAMEMERMDTPDRVLEINHLNEHHKEYIPDKAPDLENIKDHEPEI